MKNLLLFALRVDLDPLHWIGVLVIASFLLLWLLQILNWVLVARKVLKYQRPDWVVNYRPASVIVCAKNEEDNLIKFLPLILSQSYDEFEVVVVNDGSYDNTGEILKEFAKKDQRLHIVTIKEDETYQHGKKFAIMCGIKGAKYEHLVFTDADCYPASNTWLKEVMSNYNDASTEIVLGYGGFEKQKGLLNKLIRYDAINIALNYFAAALKGKAYMGVGRNLSYKKSLFFKHKGFASHYFINSGDDDLFVNEAATRYNTKIEIKPAAFTVSMPKQTLKDWFYQKRRHITTYAHYNPNSKRRFQWQGFLLYGYWAALAVASLAALYLNDSISLYVVLAAWFLRILLKYIVYANVLKRFGERDLLQLLWVYELILLFLYPIIRFSNTFMKKNAWKS